MWWGVLPILVVFTHVSVVVATTDFSSGAAAGLGEGEECTVNAECESNLRCDCSHALSLSSSEGGISSSPGGGGVEYRNVLDLFESPPASPGESSACLLSETYTIQKQPFEVLRFRGFMGAIIYRVCPANTAHALPFKVCRRRCSSRSLVHCGCLWHHLRQAPTTL